MEQVISRMDDGQNSLKGLSPKEQKQKEREIKAASIFYDVLESTRPDFEEIIKQPVKWNILDGENKWACDLLCLVHSRKPKTWRDYLEAAENVAEKTDHKQLAADLYYDAILMVDDSDAQKATEAIDDIQNSISNYLQGEGELTYQLEYAISQSINLFKLTGE